VKRVYTQEIDAFIREHASEMTCREMLTKLKEEFGFKATYVSVHSYYTKNHIQTCPRKGRKRPELRITTPEMDLYIHENHKGTGPTEMAARVNERFGTNFSQKQMSSYYKRNHLRSGLTGHFEKGQESWTKGKTWAEFMSPEGMENSRKYQFKKGNIPHNGNVPVGEMRIRIDRRRYRYWWQKLAQPNVWRQKHVLEWEKHHGPVPEGYVITFCDGDTTNWHIENLILSTKAQHAVKNRERIHGYDRESEIAANAIAELKITAARKRKKTGTKK